jgi:hypothetical protein
MWREVRSCLLDRDGLRYAGRLPRPRAVSTRDATFDSPYGRVGEQAFISGVHNVVETKNNRKLYPNDP